MGTQRVETEARQPERPAGAGTGTTAWPAGLRRVVSAVLLFHIAAILAAALASHPSSLLERSLAEKFGPYFQAIDQGYAYRYYAPEPPPTPVVTATIHYSGGRPDEPLRLPRQETFPWLLRQRQLALANHLYNDVQDARFGGGDSSRSRWARSYARHLAHTHPGSSSITLFAQLHLIPDVERVRALVTAPGAKRVNLDAEEFYTAPEWIGEYSP